MSGGARCPDVEMPFCKVLGIRAAQANDTWERQALRRRICQGVRQSQTPHPLLRGEACAAVEHDFIRGHGLYRFEDALLHNTTTSDKPLSWPEPHALGCISTKLPKHGRLEEDCIRWFLGEVGLHVNEAAPGVADHKRGVSTAVCPWEEDTSLLHCFGDGETVREDRGVEVKQDFVGPPIRLQR